MAGLYLVVSYSPNKVLHLAQEYIRGDRGTKKFLCGSHGHEYLKLSFFGMSVTNKKY